MKYLDAVNSARTAKAFLRSLHDSGLLYHPEESAKDCLNWHELPDSTLTCIEQNMKACFKYLADPCEIAVEVSR